jgi:hypothetical protein
VKRMAMGRAIIALGYPCIAFFGLL